MSKREKLLSELSLRTGPDGDITLGQLERFLATPNWRVQGSLGECGVDVYDVLLRPGYGLKFSASPMCNSFNFSVRGGECLTKYYPKPPGMLTEEEVKAIELRVCMVELFRFSWLGRREKISAKEAAAHLRANHHDPVPGHVLMALKETYPHLGVEGTVISAKVYDDGFSPVLFGFNEKGYFMPKADVLWDRETFFAVSEGRAPSW